MITSRKTHKHKGKIKWKQMKQNCEITGNDLTTIVHIHEYMRDQKTRRRRTDKQTNRQIDKQTDKQTNRQTDKQTNRQTDKQTNRQTDRQTDK
jgi:hypothetical protein